MIPLSDGYLEILRRLDVWNQERTADTFKGVRQKLFSQLAKDYLHGIYHNDPSLNDTIAFFLSEVAFVDLQKEPTGACMGTHDSFDSEFSHNAVKTESELDSLVKAYDFGELLTSESFKKKLDQMYNATAGTRQVPEMLCALRCATMDALSGEVMTRIDLAYIASEMLYQFLYQITTDPLTIQKDVDESVRYFCDFLNNHPNFRRYGRAYYVNYGDVIDPATMEHKTANTINVGYDDKPALSAKPRVKPYSCYFYDSRVMQEPVKKAQVEIIWR